MKNSEIYGVAEMEEYRNRVKNEKTIVEAIELICEHRATEANEICPNVISQLNDLIKFRKYQHFNGEIVDEFENPIIRNYAHDGNEDRLWNCFERAIRATS